MPPTPDPKDPNRRWQQCSCGCDNFMQTEERTVTRVVTPYNNLHPDAKPEMEERSETICWGCGKPAVDFDPLGMAGAEDGALMCPNCQLPLEEIKGHDGNVALTACLWGCGWRAP